MQTPLLKDRCKWRGQRTVVTQLPLETVPRLFGDERDILELWFWALSSFLVSILLQKAWKVFRSSLSFFHCDKIDMTSCSSSEPFPRIKSVALRIFTLLCNHHRCPFLELVHHSKQKLLYPWHNSSPFLFLAPGSHYSTFCLWICLFQVPRINGIIGYASLDV